MAQHLSLIFDQFTLSQVTDRQKRIQIFLLQQQLRVLKLTARHPRHVSRFDKTLLAGSSKKLKSEHKLSRG
jgi:hypothetical protein